MNPAYLVVADYYSRSDDWGIGGGTFGVRGGMIGWHGDGQIRSAAENKNNNWKSSTLDFI